VLTVATATWAQDSPLSAPVPRHRSLILGERPGQNVWVAGAQVTVLRLEEKVNPERTQLRQGAKDFEPLQFTEWGLLVTPRAGAKPGREYELEMAYEAGTVVLPLKVSEAYAADAQVEVYRTPSTPGAMQASLSQARTEVASLLWQLAQSEEQLDEAHARLQEAEEEAHSVEAALATLLLDDEVAEQLPFFDEKKLRREHEVLILRLYHFAGRTACVVEVRNRHPIQAWRLEAARLTQEGMRQEVPARVRAWPEVLPPGATGRIVLVTRTPPPGNKARFRLRLLASERPTLIEWADLEL
jgi:hypothetical protein